MLGLNGHVGFIIYKLFTWDIKLRQRILSVLKFKIKRNRKWLICKTHLLKERLVNLHWQENECKSHYVRVVKEVDSKSTGISRVGSNPADDVFINFQTWTLLQPDCILMIKRET